MKCRRNEDQGSITYWTSLILTVAIIFMGVIAIISIGVEFISWVMR